ncbi:MAG: ATP-binding protein, partial [Cyclobacteriaceae bacterium]
RGGGLFFLDSADYELSQASFINSDELIWTVEKDKNDLLWIGHGSSMKIYDPKKDKLVDLSIYNLDKPETKVGFYSLYIDDESFVWGGTYSDGFKIFNPYASPFLLINHEAGNANSLSHDIVMSIASLGNNLIAIGTRSGWINIFNLNTKNNKRISTVEKWNYLGDILAICPYGDDMLIGTYLHGLIHCDKDGNKIKQYMAVNSADKNQLKDNDVRFIKDLGNGQFLVGTNEAGLHLFEPKTGQFEFIEAWPWSGGALKGVFDKSGNLWVASYYGLKRYDASTFVGIDFYTADPQNDNSISKNHITDVHFTRSNLLCLGTFGGGLNLFDIDSETIIKFTENEGFANNIVSSLTEDGNGNLWIGTANGISMLDIDNLQIVNFHEGDGLPASKFNFRSNALIDSAMIVKGTSTGLVVFNPNDILSKSVKASLVITNTIVNNREFIPEIRQRNDSILFDLSLNYDQSDIEFTYAAISYTQAEEIQYQFRLEPVHSNWINQRKNRKITLPALAPGNYTFKLRAQIAPNEFVELRPVLISIKPPLWNTKLFKSAVAFGTIFLFIIIYLWRTHAIRRKNEALKILVDNRTQELSNSHNALTNSYQKIQVQNDEIQAQNEELQSQNEEILSQRDNLAAQHRELGVIKNSLDLANEELQSLNQKLELKVEERTKRLSKVIQDLDRFVYSASHELISPLKSVTGLLNLMEHDKSEINQQKYLQMIGSSIAKLENLVKNLLDYSRNTKADINIEEISLQPFINELLQENEGLNKNVLLINEIPDGVYIKTDVRRLKIVLNNLISNSLKYADLTKNDPFVKVKCDYTDFENYVIYIADNGIGIKKEYQSKLFDMYFRATTKASGSGLGLYISREIISPLGGTIELEASEASGTIFKVVMQKA